MVFHGTNSYNHASIKEKGLVVPGKHGVRVVNGSAYGVGIYLARCPRMSLSYVRQEPKLLVCAVLTGDTTKVTNHGNVLVAKDDAYVLPCYVVEYSGQTPSRAYTYSQTPLQRAYYFSLDILKFITKMNYFLGVLLVMAWTLGALAFVFGPTPTNFVYYICTQTISFICTLVGWEFSLVYNLSTIGFHVAYGTLIALWTAFYYLCYGIFLIIYYLFYVLFYGIYHTAYALWSVLAALYDVFVSDKPTTIGRAASVSLEKLKYM